MREDKTKKDAKPQRQKNKSKIFKMNLAAHSEPAGAARKEASSSVWIRRLSAAADPLHTDTHLEYPGYFNVINKISVCT